MDKKIIVSFPTEIIDTEKPAVVELINSALDSIKPNVLNWNGFVDFTTTNTGNYLLIAKCDNDEIQAQMQELINAEVSKIY